MPQINFIPATGKQLNYIDILVVDLNLTIKERNFHISKLVKRDIKAPDELSKSEASLVISKMIEWKQNNSIRDAEVQSVEKTDPRDDDWGFPDDEVPF